MCFQLLPEPFLLVIMEICSENSTIMFVLFVHAYLHIHLALVLHPYCIPVEVDINQKGHK